MPNSITTELDVLELLRKSRPNAQMVRQLLAVQRGQADYVDLVLEGGEVVRVEAVPMVRAGGGGELVEDPRMAIQK